MVRTIRLWIALASLVVLAACGGGAKDPLPADQLTAVAFRSDTQPSLTLITMINNGSGGGAHSALIVNGSQRVLFDPAGSYRPDYVTEYGDVLYGMSDVQIRRYKSAHARQTHHVVTQEIPVSAAVAEQALALVQARGRVASALCTNSTSGILRQLSGFEDVQSTFFPKNLMKQFAVRPGVVTDRHYENDAGDVLDGLPDPL